MEKYKKILKDICIKLKQYEDLNSLGEIKN